MKKVQEYKLKGVRTETLCLPLGARILTVKDIHGEPTIFALIDVDELQTEDRIIHHVRTGLPQSDSLIMFEYLGSFFIAGFRDVYHIFEERKRPVPKAQIEVIISEGSVDANE